MYVYDEHDQKIIEERVRQYRGQTERYLAGELEEDEFLPLRLQNGLYVQRYAPMLRIAIPYGMLTAKQLRVLADISRKYDKDYAHFSTRQNLQLNWPNLEDVPDILAELATVQMHAVQTSGNCIRNTTADQFAGVTTDEILDSRPYCEIIRQWSTFHPEFAFLPRKFKIAVSGAIADRAAIQAHDIGLQIKINDAGEVGFQVLVGGGLGRTPILGKVVKEFLPEKHLLSYLDAILRIYNQEGRRDNKYKARIKILVRALGVDVFGAKVEEEWDRIKDGYTTLTNESIAHAKSFFTEPAYENINDEDAEKVVAIERDRNPAFLRWLEKNTLDHRKPGYRIVNLSLKPTGVPPGDVTDKQMDAIADLSDQYSFGELRSTHEQNLVLADVKKADLFELWEKLCTLNIATPNIGHLTDMICCPGGDFCALANAKSIPIAKAIQAEFDDIDMLYDLGKLQLNISGCMNACGHHHIGNIGILGVDKKGAEFYQISIGGSAANDAAIGAIVGPSFAQDDIPAVIKKIISVYVDKRNDGEAFLETYRRIGIEPFKEKIYA